MTPATPRCWSATTARWATAPPGCGRSCGKRASPGSCGRTHWTRPPDSAGQIDRFLAEKLRGRAPEEAEKRRLTGALLRRGYDWGEVKAAWSRLGAEIPED